MKFHKRLFKVHRLRALSNTSETSNAIILKLIQSLPLNKENGLDGIFARLFKEAGAIVSASLTFIINMSWTTGIFPDDWKVAKVSPNICLSNLSGCGLVSTATTNPFYITSSCRQDLETVEWKLNALWVELVSKFPLYDAACFKILHVTLNFVKLSFKYFKTRYSYHKSSFSNVNERHNTVTVSPEDHNPPQT